MAINRIEGTGNNDFLTDTISDDEIFAFGGDDRIEVSSGNDTVDGGEGNDRLVANYSSQNEDLQFNFNGSGYFDWNNNYSMSGLIDVSSNSNSNYNSQINFNNIEDFIFTSGSGNDSIVFGYENYSDDEIDAGAGDDLIYAGLGNDTIDGGSGFDVLRLDYYSSPNAVISSLSDRNSGQYSNGYDTVNFSNIEAINVIGSNYNDVLVSIASSNISSVNPLPLHQMIDGGEGKDRLVANYSDRSEDLEFNFNATSNYNQFDYPSFNGSINANSTDGYSSQIDFNNIENFTITSGSGNDRLVLGYDNFSDDEVNAGAGDDFIDAGLGNDTIDGGAGFDVLNLDYSLLPPDARVVSKLTGSNSGEYDDGFGIVKFENIEALNVFGSNRDDVLVALDSNNIGSMNSLPMNQMIDGGEGKDRLVADYSDRTEDLQFNFNIYNSYSDSYNNHSLSGLIDVNAYNNGNYNSQINFNNIENFAFTSGSGNDNIDLGYDSYSDDLLDAGAGDDFINAGLGNDTIDGGTGFDVLSLDYYSSTNAVTSSLSDRNSGQYSDGINLVDFSNIEALNVFGSNYNDVLVALSSNSNIPSMNSLPMNQMIDGGEGKDRLVADYSSRSEDLELNFNNTYSNFDGNNNRSLSGSLDAYAYDSGNYNSQIDFNNIESFSITSGDGNDRLVLGYENFSDDMVNAGGGNDFIDAGLGNDTIDGGAGFDVLNLNYQFGFDGVTSSLSDRNSGQYSDGFNTVDFDNIEALSVIGSNYNDVLVALTDNLNSSANLPMSQWIDGAEGKDRLVADYSNRTENLQFNFNSYGNSGSLDVYSYFDGNYNSRIDFSSIESFQLDGGRGNDQIDLGYDNFSNDLINAGEGNDRIIASFGDDTIDGGRGNDIFVYERGHGSDLIYDQSGNNDTIAFGTTISLDSLSLNVEDDDLVIDVIDSPGDRLTIKDYAISGNSIENIDINGQTFSIEEMIAADSEPEPAIGTIGEFGRVNNFDHNSQTIQLEHNFENPVVFALPLSRNGGDPSIVRITDIQSDSFTAYLQEAEYRDGSHGKESFSYMVLEAGTWELENGALLEVGTVDTNKTTKQGWEKINFDADFAKLPVILSQVQTNQDNEFVRTRQYQASVDGFRLSMEEEEALRNSGHGQETVGWLAMDAGIGDLGDLSYQAGHTGRRVDHNSAQINFKQDFTSKPSLFASLASFYGADAAGLRYQSLSPTQTTIMLEEDQSRDNEVGHTKENVSFLAIDGTGDLTAIAYEPDFV